MNIFIYLIITAILYAFATWNSIRESSAGSAVVAFGLVIWAVISAFQQYHVVFP